jgi:hypothetical protein
MTTRLSSRLLQSDVIGKRAPIAGVSGERTGRRARRQRNEKLGRNGRARRVRGARVSPMIPANPMTSHPAKRTAPSITPEPYPKDTLASLFRANHHRQPIPRPAVASFFQVRSTAGRQPRNREGRLRWFFLCDLCVFAREKKGFQPRGAALRLDRRDFRHGTRLLDRPDFRKIPWLLVSATTLAAFRD